MKTVFCDEFTCKYFKDEECKLKIISISNGKCKNYEMLPEEELFPDVFFAKIKENGLNKWVENRGKKIIVLGREMFKRWGKITDGRTGIFICREESIENIESNPEKFLKAILKAEKELGISPLYEKDTNTND